MASTPYISIDIYVYTCIEARLSTGSYFPVRQRVVVLVWSSRPVQLLMYSPTRITSSSLAHFSHFKCPLSFIFSLSFPSLIPPPSSPALSLARTRSYAHHIYHTFYLSDTILSFSSTVLSSPPPIHTLLLLLALFLYLYMYVYIYISIPFSVMPTYLTDWIARLPLPRNCLYGLSNDFPRHGFYRLLLSPCDRDSFATPTGKFVNYSATYAQLYDCLSHSDRIRDEDRRGRTGEIVLARPVLKGRKPWRHWESSASINWKRDFKDTRSFFLF